MCLRCGVVGEVLLEAQLLLHALIERQELESARVAVRVPYRRAHAE